MTSPKRYLRTIASFLVLLLLAPEALEAAKRKRPVSRKAITGKTVRPGKARLRRPAGKRRPKPRPVPVETQPRVAPESRVESAPTVSAPVEPVPASSVAFRPAVFTAPVPVADWDYGTPKLEPKPQVQYPILRAVDRPHFEPLVLLAQGATPAPGS
ncbi:MAG: hypothetical protein JNN08_05720, partial [Bryobacterales bacterium]|nr:hypothetical protein [Bryobacterales bacterium]